MFTKTLRNYLPLILILILAAFLRLIWLDKIPNAVGGDEINYIVTAKSIALAGTDITGTWNPLSAFIFHYPPGETQSELPYFLLLPVLKFANFSLLSARIVYALMSILTVLLIYLISLKLFSKNAAIFTGFIAAINPWFIYIGRTDYEVVPTTLFFLCSLYILLVTKANKIFLCLPFLLMAFYSYIATKVIFLPFTFLIILYVFFYVNNKKYFRQYLGVLLFCLVVVLFFVLSVKSNPDQSRLEELISINDPVIVKQVDYLRKNSIQSPFTDIFENKPVILAEIISEKFFNTISFNYLFSQADLFFPITNHGLFYVIDFIFIILGALFMFAKQRRAAFFLIGLIFISVIPHIAHQVKLDNFTPHIALLFPFVIIFAGYGIWATITFLKSRKYFLISLIVILILYLVSLLNFLNIYFYQFPIGGYFNFPVRVFSRYASISVNSKHKVIIYSPRSYDIFKKYLFYANALNKDTVKEVKDAVLTKNYKLGNVSFVSCNKIIDFSKTSDTVIYDSDCGANPVNSQYIIIPRLSDGGASYRIYNDNICKDFVLKPYPSGITIDDFAIENMSREDFCKTFITSP